MRSLTGFLNVKNEKHGLLSGRPKPPAPPVFKECSLSSGIFPDGGEAVSLPLPVTDSTHIPWLLASSLLWSSSLHLVLTTTKRMKQNSLKDISNRDLTTLHFPALLTVTWSLGKKR